VSNKQIVQQLLDRLPEEASLSDIAEEIQFLAGVREGLAELDRGETRTADQLRESLRKWSATR
jgi:hypothetical protein